MTVRLFDRQTLLTHPIVTVTEAEIAVRDPDGGWGERMRRVVVERGHAVAILAHAVLPDDSHRLILVRQFRYPVYDTDMAAPDEGYMLELVAGMISGDETPLATAHRELEEETGLVAQQAEQIARLHTSPGILSETVTLYYCRIETTPDRIDETGKFGVGDEDIRLVAVTPAEFLQSIADGTITDAKAFAAAEWIRREPARFGLP